ncbi:heavy metal-associated isoprenylated plant protein 41-like [Prosopis cineraria]|uniref:heavy metal-associated isoprenylated plant protein 41-like n=1 Tax=Prosopis cineraria TaxID=364024 RepID=UPI00240EEB2A|nr:heavy metal-associated isoprenylated plant protein 41-like [Prosopis cineraria]XP_054796313.1 heavy metal-associated isoprenylated plant protein 41-like [Prosopis cineraria]
MSNLLALTKLGAMVLHGVDATQMKFHPYLEMRKFDRIIFNFSHAGFHGKEDIVSLIQKHRNLVRGFFEDARSMLRPNGEIHINHATPPFTDWNIGKLGDQSSLRLIECVDFKQEDYPGYHNKRGNGFRCDEPFPLGKCSTFKFSILMNGKPNAMNHQRDHSNHYPMTMGSRIPILGGGYSNTGMELLGRANF